MSADSTIAVARSEETDLGQFPGHPAVAGSAAWDQFRLRVESETGMDFSGTRFRRLCDAVRKVVAQHPQPVPLERLLAAPDQHGPWLEWLTAEVTVGESYFFRNEFHFRALREHVVPAILQNNAGQQEVRIWSAGCATGEEPYSLAILLDQVLAGRLGWHVSILGTDLNPEYLVRARQAQYRAWSFRQTDLHQDRRYFAREGDEFRLVSGVREWVRFAYLNLVKDVYPSPLTGTLGLDLILFRNVAIYLRPEVTREILERLRRALRPGGWLLLGEAEVGLASEAGFEVRRFDQATLHRKTAEARARPTPEALPTSPVLAVVSRLVPSRPVLPSSAPELPTWVPLPVRRQPGCGPPGPAAGGPSTETWDRLAQALAAGRFEAAEHELQGAGSPRARAQLRLRYSQALLGAGEMARARRMVEVCLQEDPLLLEAQLLAASLAEEAGELAVAERGYRRALYLDRHLPVGHFHLANVQQQTGNAAGAARSLRTAWELIETRDPHALVEQGEGVCYGRLKEMVAAVMAGLPQIGREDQAAPAASGSFRR